MPVYLPTAAVGSSRLLATLGHSGELMALFYPHFDYAQNVHECMPALWLDDDRRRGLTWTFGGEWEREQRYEPGTNIVETTLKHQSTGLSLSLADFAPVDTAAFVRRYHLRNEGREPVRGVLYFYADFNLGEVANRNFLRFEPAHDAFIQSWREFSLCVGGTPFDETVAGRAIEADAANAKIDLEDGRLNGQPFSLGDANVAGAWRFELAPGAELQRDLFLVCDQHTDAALDLLARLKARGLEALRDCARRRAASWLATMRTPEVEERYLAHYRQALLAMSLLFDEKQGSCLAAPEFDPGYLESGGYGYCWPRDAAEFVEAVCLAGSTDWAEKFLRWCGRTQTPEGLWYQRYWLSGKIAPSWSIPSQALQIDQIGAVIHSLWVAWRSVGEGRRHELLGEHWGWMLRAVVFIEHNLEPHGLHATAYDLWETFRGSFAYSNAALWGALSGAAELAEARGETRMAVRWRERAAAMKAACLEHFVDVDRFARGFNERGDLDWTPDSAALGMADPFDMLDAANEADRDVMKRMVDFVECHLRVEDARGPTIRRYEGDSYVGGPASAVSTLWLARVLFRLAQHEPGGGCLARGKTYLDSCLAHSTPTGLLPELLGATHPYWAAPHGWAEGSLVRAVLELEQAEAARRP